MREHPAQPDLASLHDSQVATGDHDRSSVHQSTILNAKTPRDGWHSYLSPRQGLEELVARPGRNSRIGYVHLADERYDERSHVERVNAGLKR